jgi:hypothetical protein
VPGVGSLCHSPGGRVKILLGAVHDTEMHLDGIMEKTYQGVTIYESSGI